MAVDSAYFVFAAFKHERRETRRRLCILFLLCAVFRKLHRKLFAQFGKPLRQKLQQLAVGCGGKAFFRGKQHAPARLETVDRLHRLLRELPGVADRDHERHAVEHGVVKFFGVDEKRNHAAGF